MKKLKLYHPSDKLFKVVKVNYFGENNYTKADVKSSPIKRIFWYLTSISKENIFEHCKYSYVTEIKRDLIYNLKKDKDNLNSKFHNIHDLLSYIKEKYVGILYQADTNYDIICLFNNITPLKIIKHKN